VPCLDFLPNTPSNTLKELVNQIPSLRHIPSLSKDQAKQSLHKVRHLLDATVVAFQKLHNWSLKLNFEGWAVVEQLKLNDDVHNKQINALTKMLGKMSASNKDPFKAIINWAAEDFEDIGKKMSLQINFTLRKMGKARKITYLTT